MYLSNLRKQSVMTSDMTKNIILSKSFQINNFFSCLIISICSVRNGTHLGVVQQEKIENLKYSPKNKRNQIPQLNKNAKKSNSIGQQSNSDSKHLKRMKIILTLIFLLILSTPKSQPLSLQLPLPSYSKNFIQMSREVPSKNKSITLTFPDINFEISSRFYTNEGALSDEQAYLPASYSGKLDQYCDMYATTSTSTKKMKLQYQKDVENLKYTMFHEDGSVGNIFYVLGSDSNLYIYSFDADMINFEGKFQVSKKISKIKDKELQTNVELIVINGRLFLINNQGLYVFDQGNPDRKYFTPVEGFEKINKLVDIGITESGQFLSKIDGTKIWVCQEKQIAIFQIKESENGLKLVKKSNFTVGTENIEAVSYDDTVNTFYIVSGHTLSSVNQKSGQKQREYQLQGICNGIKKIKSTLYISCRYDRNSFIAEIRVDADDVMVLNRYYDNTDVQGIRDVQYMGFDRIAIVGDEQSIIIGEAVNRNTLLDLSHRKIYQKYQNVFSFGLMDIYYLPQFSNPKKSLIFVVGDESVSMHQVVYQPPQLQCSFFYGKHGDILQTLIIFNTSHCPSLTIDQLKKSGTFTQCQTYYPVKIQFLSKQYEQKTANFIFFVVMLTLIVGVLIVVGFGLKSRNQHNVLIQALKNKIQKLKQAQDDSEMKKL